MFRAAKPQAYVLTYVRMYVCMYVCTARALNFYARSKAILPRPRVEFPVRSRDVYDAEAYVYSPPSASG
jgi:hypothetical protein